MDIAVHGCRRGNSKPRCSQSLISLIWGGEAQCGFEFKEENKLCKLKGGRVSVSFHGKGKGKKGEARERRQKTRQSHCAVEMAC